MQYLAFDIECANQYVSGSMCSMGVVVADQNFNIIHSEDILINPRCRIFDKHCKLVYEPEMYTSAPNFAVLYPTIKKFLEQPDTVVLGHAVGNDVRFLDQALKRYSLPAPSFSYVCTQLLYREFAKQQNSISVENVAEMLGLQSLTSHKAEDDAFVSLMLLKYLIEETGLQLNQMLTAFKMVEGKYSQNGHFRHLSGQHNKNELFLRATKNSPDLPKNKKERKACVKFCFDSLVWTTDVDFARDLLYSQFAKGWVYHTDYSGLTYFVILEDSQTHRLNKVEQQNQNGSNIIVLTTNELERTVFNNYSSDQDTLRHG